MSDSGGTLTLPSPTHPHHHHVDVQAGLRSLRRSLSRSPSKLSLARTASQSSSDNNSTPSSPSCRRVQSQYFGHSPSINPPPSTLVHTQSPLATPFRPSVKLSLRSAKAVSKSTASSSTAAKQISRNRTSPRSPSRRALNAAATSGNCAPSPSIDTIALSGQENTNIFSTRSPARRRSADKASNRHSMHLDISGSSQSAMARLSEANSNATSLSSVASPLKRSDATMSLGQTFSGSSGSPKAKRRSYGPSSLGTDFNIFDHGPVSPNLEAPDNLNREYDWTTSSFSNPSEPLPPPTPAAMPRRAGSLRKSTLNQRHTGERTSWGRRHAAQQLLQSANETTTPNAKNRPRLSLDQFLPLPVPRDSPFSNAGPLPNASAHILGQPSHQPHPLSRTMTTSSSSNSSLVDDSPTHFPVHMSEKPKTQLNWSKSLPLGSDRPKPDKQLGPKVSISTPDYKSARPFEGAFASTGLVSKMNRNPELGPLGGGFGAIVPDTPCKKQVSGFATYPPPPAHGTPKSRGRHIKHTFGTPPTPFSLGERPRPVPFSGFAAKHTRKSSLLSLHSDEGPSPTKYLDESQTGAGELPPTPTKHQLLGHSPSNLGRLFDASPTADRHFGAPTSAARSSRRRNTNASCKYSPPQESSDDSHHERGSISPGGSSDSPASAVQGTSPTMTNLALQSFSKSRAKRGSFPTPPPLVMTALKSITKPKSIVQFAKTRPMISASPLELREFTDHAAPTTPVEAVIPPDASRLSISNPSEGFLFPASERRSIFAPATPTTKQDGLSLFSDRRAVTPIHGAPSQEVDGLLVARFGKVDFIGRGEFSQVYRVTKLEQPGSTIQRGFFSTPTHHTPPSPSPNQVFAVKKLVLPILGDKDRALRFREVSALRALRNCDHVLQLIDSWEENNNLYIQTEYCEEGSLKEFLSVVGMKGKLDEFRIWKILFETSQGLQCIHDAGYVHLDIKPANIFITFEGTLKIGDFGLATSLPAVPGPDFEGDREYLAPEALRSEFDRPADIFSLGLIMLEIAANVKLPENGTTWTALREGDFSEIPFLTNDASAIPRDVTGLPIDESERSLSLSGDESHPPKDARYNTRGTNRHTGDIFGLGRKSELQYPPEFMTNPSHPSSLDNVVRSMLAAEPMYRLTVSEILKLEAVCWVASRRRAGATVFEGNWGPADDMLEPMSLDTEMTDV
ncbi:hypothetical protein F4778DRAFT_772740 [Xylariomycetidae sp. FL2044]|nr:hypothetical protein F4778DRAFT_772740 [Xylariomycetidae sp. FL2044]